MATDERRHKQLGELIHQIVAGIVNDIVQTPAGTLITVSGIVLSANHQHATVQVTVYPFEQAEDMMALLEENIGDIQHTLNQKLQMRPVPKLRFELDDSEERAQRIYSLLDDE